MKPREFVSKYKLDENSEKFDRKGFIADFELEFASLLQIGKAKEYLPGFDNAVRALRMKWDAISNKSKTGLPENLWKFFFATSIAPTREAFFPNEMNRRREEKARREEYRRFRNGYESSFFNDFRNAFFGSMFEELLRGMKQGAVPTKEFALLSLNPDTATVDDVQKEFRQASLKCHPDKGGTDAQMCEILEARKKCLAHLGEKRS